MGDVSIDTWVLLCGGLVTAIIAGLGLRFINKKSVMGRGSVVDQSKSKANGDIVGRDKTTNKR